ncbi:5'-nucleotidase C-terminal domain-containing protein [Daejeonella sp. JGW-45]|uniref:bifunctional metallophosphatase/5'-nucleotidase n=1 Tax=Daejeonella sp. JGW-45 TaxID=3034148 RepID=UPI0023ECD8A3|nr:5'-nucleotidase C-terminal domain-containing protein [Daejeonella sp. JGW-45]
MKLSIAYLNDVHGYLEPHPELMFDAESRETKVMGGYSRIYSLIKDIRRQNLNTLVLDGGDTFHGTLPVVKSKGEAIVPVLNKIGFNAMVGHWDFAYGPDQLLKLNDQLNYPVLGINVYKNDETLFLKPFIIQAVESVKIAIIGICSNIIDKTMPENFSDGLKITDGTEELPRYIEQVKMEGADLVFLLSHNGYPQDIKMLSEIKGIDVCLSAHTHNRLSEPSLINDTILIQCGCHGSFLGHLELEILDKQINSYKYQLIPVNDSIEPDKEMDQLIEAIMKPYQKLQKEHVGETSILLDRYNTLESSMDDLLLQSIKETSSADIAFSNGWRYGVPIPAGPVNRWDLFNIIPMNPPVSVVELTGKEILDMLEENLERTFSADPMKQMGGYVKRCLGLTAYIRIENPKGFRLQDVFIGKEHLRPGSIYKVAFVTQQGVPKNLGKNRIDLSIHVVDALTSFLQKNSPYRPHLPKSFSLI